MKTRNIYWRGVFAALTLATVCMLVPATRGDTIRSDRVEIRFHQRVHLDRGVVRIMDIADVLGGNRATRERIKRLDVAELSADKPFTIIRQRQVRMRCLIIGLKDQHIVITGARSILADVGPGTNAKPVAQSDPDSTPASDRASDPDLEQLTLNAIRSELSTLWQIPVDELFVRLQRPLQTKRTIAAGASGISVRAYFPGRTAPGSVSAVTVINVPDQEPIHTTVNVNVQHRPRPESSDSAPRLAGPAGIAQASHSTPGARNPRLPGFASLRKTPGPVVVRSRSRLQLVAQKANLRVTLAGAEAMESGRVGDSIRVRNLQTKKIVFARLVSSSEAVIEL